MLVRIFKLFSVSLIFFLTPFFAQATGDFNVDPSYDYLGRSKITAFLYQIGVNAYFYVEDGHYQSLDDEEKKQFSANVKNLSQEFDSLIYPQITSAFGFEWKPGIDKDEKITVLLTRIKGESGGYFNFADEYPKTQSPISNEREMVYLNVNYLNDSLIKGYLAHEFSHLITFNQKNLIQGRAEEIWLNELRADLAPTILGYDDIYQGSNLQKRVSAFVQKPEDSLTEWKDAVYDYGTVNLFGQYLLDHYGKKILTDSFKSEKTGILSVDEALKKAGFAEDFSQIFTNWTIALLVNDCNLGKNYCYLNPNLKNLKILPKLNYLPTVAEGTLTVTDYSKDWSGNWFKFIGGKGTLKIDFIGNEKIIFRVPYLIQDSLGNYSLSSLKLNGSQRGTVYITNFGAQYNSFIMIPSVQNKTSGFNGSESYHQFIWSASIISENPEKEEELIQSLLSQIEYLKSAITRVRAQINAILGVKEGMSCQTINNNLYYGMENNDEVRCLQEFLKNQGAEIYPEGLVTGNFLSLTEAAVIRFQEKYANDILIPLGLERGTGFVGQSTRAKLNSLSGSR